MLSGFRCLPEREQSDNLLRLNMSCGVLEAFWLRGTCFAMHGVAVGDLLDTALAMLGVLLKTGQYLGSGDGEGCPYQPDGNHCSMSWPTEARSVGP